MNSEKIDELDFRLKHDDHVLRDRINKDILTYLQKDRNILNEIEFINLDKIKSCLKEYFKDNKDYEINYILYIENYNKLFKYIDVVNFRLILMYCLTEDDYTFLLFLILKKRKNNKFSYPY